MSSFANKLFSSGVLAIAIWILTSLYISKFNLFSLDSFNKYTTKYFNIPTDINSQYIPDISRILPYDFTHIPPSNQTIPSLFIIAIPKTGSSSLIKWLINTKEIFGDIALTNSRVENNVIWKYYVDKVISRNNTIGFYLSDQQIIDYDDKLFIDGFIRGLYHDERRRTKRNKTKRIKARLSNQRSSRFKQLKNARVKSRNLLRKHSKKQIKRRSETFYRKRTNISDINLSEVMHYTVGKSVFYFHLPYMARLFAIKYPNTKILITIRNPILRLQSNFLFFIGAEMERLPKLYGNVNLYLQHIMNHKLLKQPFEDIKNNLTLINSVNDMNITVWHNVFRAYKVFLINMVQMCKEEFDLMGFLERDVETSCKERDLIRSAFGVSCYIVPIMYWYMINLNVKRNFRIVQSEIMFENPNEHITKILCWVQKDRNDICNGWNDKKWDTDSEWRKSEKNKLKVDINDGLKMKVKENLMQCDIGLKRFIEHHEFVQLSTFDLSMWE